MCPRSTPARDSSIIPYFYIFIFYLGPARRVHTSAVAGIGRPSGHSCKRARARAGARARVRVRVCVRVCGVRLHGTPVSVFYACMLVLLERSDI